MLKKYNWIKNICFTYLSQIILKISKKNKESKANLQVSSSIKEFTSSDDLIKTSIFPPLESIKSSNNKYTSDINKSHALKRSSNNPLNPSILTSCEEYDPENALYSHEHLNKKPKLETSSYISTISKNGSTLIKSAAKERFSKSSEKSLTQSQYSKSSTTNLNNKVPKSIGSTINKKRTLDFLES